MILNHPVEVFGNPHRFCDDVAQSARIFQLSKPGSRHTRGGNWNKSGSPDHSRKSLSQRIKSEYRFLGRWQSRHRTRAVARRYSFQRLAERNRRKPANHPAREAVSRSLRGVLSGGAVVSAFDVLTQDKTRTADEPAAGAREVKMTLVKVAIMFVEFEGNKKVKSLPYTHR